MSGQVYGGTGGGACPSCGGFPPNCQCHAQAEARAKAMAEVSALQERKTALLRQVGEVAAKLEAYKVKCATCRCHIFPWEVCPCCRDPGCIEDGTKF